MSPDQLAVVHFPLVLVHVFDDRRSDPGGSAGRDARPNDQHKPNDDAGDPEPVVDKDRQHDSYDYE